MLVKGYSREKYDNGTRQEKVFAIYPNGLIYQSQWARWSPDFGKMLNGHERTWERISALPDDATYCGNYRAPF